MVLAVKTKKALPMAMEIMVKSNPFELKSLDLVSRILLCFRTQENPLIRHSRRPVRQGFVDTQRLVWINHTATQASFVRSSVIHSSEERR